jgi:hypothetical protein
LASDRAKPAALRHTPSFVFGPPDDRRDRVDHRHPYTTGTVVELLSWPQSKVKATLGALAHIEKKVLNTVDLMD